MLVALDLFAKNVKSMTGTPQRPSRRRNPGRTAPGTRCTVGLPSALATEVTRYAEAVDTSMSKAIATLVRLGLESQAGRKREFFENAV